MPELVSVHCPYCGEPIELTVDPSVEASAYVEDCPVCCRPIQVEADVRDDEVSVSVRTGDE